MAALIEPRSWSSAAEDQVSGVVQARAVVAAVPRAALKLVEGSGHTPQLEAPAALARLAAGFLTR